MSFSGQATRPMSCLFCARTQWSGVTVQERGAWEVMVGGDDALCLQCMPCMPYMSYMRESIRVDDN